MHSRGICLEWGRFCATTCALYHVVWFYKRKYFFSLNTFQLSAQWFVWKELDEFSIGHMLLRQMAFFNLHKTLLFNFLPELFPAHGWFPIGQTCTADNLQYTYITIQVYSSAEHHQLYFPLIIRNCIILLMSCCFEWGLWKNNRLASVEVSLTILKTEYR